MFDLEISMGSTRRTFFLSYLLVQALYNAGNYILLVLLVLSEKKIRSFLIAQDITVGKKAELIWPWTIYDRIYSVWNIMDVFWKSCRSDLVDFVDGTLSRGSEYR